MTPFNYVHSYSTSLQSYIVPEVVLPDLEKRKSGSKVLYGPSLLLLLAACSGRAVMPQQDVIAPLSTPQEAEPDTDMAENVPDTEAQQVADETPEPASQEAETEIAEPAASQTLEGTDGDDSLTGDSGDDVLRGHAGDDVLDGASGNDTLEGARGSDEIYGGEGQDTVTFANEEVGVKVVLDRVDELTLANGTVTEDYVSGYSEYRQAGSNELDIIEEVENIIGSDHDDELSGNELDNEIQGNAGDDEIFGEGGSDQLSGGAGVDSYFVKLSDNSDKTVIADYEPFELVRLDGGNFADAAFERQESGFVLSLGTDKVVLEQTTADDTALNFEFDDVAVSGNLSSFLPGGDFADARITRENNDISIMLPNASSVETTSEWVVQEGEAFFSITIFAFDTLQFSFMRVPFEHGFTYHLNVGGDEVISLNQLLIANDDGRIVGTSAPEILHGSDADEQIEIEGGDTAIGGEGDDNFIISSADFGEDNRIVDFETGDRITFEGEAPTDLSYHWTDDGDFVISHADEENTASSPNSLILEGEVLDEEIQIQTADATTPVTLTKIAGTNDDDELAVHNQDYSIGLDGDDVFNITLPETGDGGAIFGGRGTDTISFDGQENAYVNLSDAVATGGYTLSSIENVTGSSFDDVIIGDAQNNMLNGQSGSDTLTGGEGSDSFVLSDFLSGDRDVITDFTVGTDKLRIHLDDETPYTDVAAIYDELGITSQNGDEGRILTFDNGYSLTLNDLTDDLTLTDFEIV